MEVAGWWTVAEFCYLDILEQRTAMRKWSMTAGKHDVVLKEIQTVASLG
jgi:hypothetical protein